MADSRKLRKEMEQKQIEAEKKSQHQRDLKQRQKYNRDAILFILVALLGILYIPYLATILFACIVVVLLYGVFQVLSILDEFGSIFRKEKKHQ